MSAIILTQSALTDASVTPVASYTADANDQEFDFVRALFYELLAAFTAGKLPENLAEFKFSKLEGPFNHMYTCSADFDSSKIPQSTKYTLTRPAYDAPRFTLRGDYFYFDCRITPEDKDLFMSDLVPRVTVVTPTEVQTEGIRATFKCCYDAKSGRYTAPKKMNMYVTHKYVNPTTNQISYETLEYVDDPELPAPGVSCIARDEPYIKQCWRRADQKGEPIWRGDFVERICHNTKMDPTAEFEVHWNKVTAPTPTPPGTKMPEDSEIGPLYDKYRWTIPTSEETERLSKLTWTERHAHVMKELKCTSNEASAVLYVDDVLAGAPFAMHQVVLRARQTNFAWTVRCAFTRAVLKP